MSVFLDRSFLLRISGRLARFARKKDDLYNFRCPMCGDSLKNKSKSRGYVYRKKNDYFFMCHNCGSSMSFFNFLKHIAPELSQEYTLEKYKLTTTTGNTAEPDFTEFKSKPVFNEHINLPTIASLPDAHFAKAYVLSRHIPLNFHSELYFAEDYRSFVESFGVEKEIYKGDQRLVIPFYDKENKLVGFQGRALGESKQRYITIRLQEDVTLFYGLNKVNREERILVLEGPLDSMFLPNAIATTNSNLESAVHFFDKEQIVLVFDNEPRNKEIVDQIEHAVDNHFKVVIWPEMVVEKDINDMVLSGFSLDEINDIIDTNTFSNLRAKIEFVNWKKIEEKGNINGRKTIK